MFYNVCFSWCLDLDFFAYPSALWAPPLTKGRNMRHTSASLHYAKVRIIFHLAKKYDKKIRLTLWG